MRYTRFGSPFAPSLVAGSEQASARIEVINPSRGFHQGDVPQDIPTGFTPDAFNFEPTSGYIRPRSGLSEYKGGHSQLSGPALGAWRMQDTSANFYLVAASNRTLSLYDPTPDTWSALSYLRPSGWGGDDTPSGTSRQYFNGTWVFDEAANKNLAFLTNNVDSPFVFNLEASVATYSNLTDFLSLASQARAVCVFDNRVIWFNTTSGNTAHPQRVLWSARGRPRNYQILDGAGAEDLLDMQGSGTHVLAEREGIILFTDEEIWRGRKRGDAYVFDFYPIERQFGAPYPMTIQRTPIGVIFLGRDLELYVIQGDNIFPIGPAAEQERSRIQSWLSEEVLELDRAWSVYNTAQRRYELYYSAVDGSEGYPTRALYYDISTRAFYPQRFNIPLSAGVDFGDAGTPLVWDNVSLTWDDILTTWDEQIEAGSGYGHHAFSSNGTNYRFRSTQTNDSGSAFTCRWTSHGLNAEDSMRFDQITDLFGDYKATSASSCSVFFGSDIAFTSSDVRSVALSAGTAKRFHASGHAVGVSPHFKIEITNGSQPHFARFQAHLKDAGLYEGEA